MASAATGAGHGETRYVNTRRTTMSYREASKKYAKIGIDTEKAIRDLGKIAISLHCW